jgi:hypothetical protein
VNQLGCRGSKATRALARRLSIAKNAVSASPVACSRASWVTALGSFTENRNAAGTVAAQRSNVRGWCGR